MTKVLQHTHYNSSAKGLLKDKLLKSVSCGKRFLYLNIVKEIVVDE